MNKLLLLYMLLNITNLQAQKQNFDLVSFTTPKGWKVDKKEKTTSFKKEDIEKGTFCLMTVYQTLDAGDDAKENFDTSWASLVKEVFSNVVPVMQPTTEDKGWYIHTGYASFEKEDITGVVILVSASGYKKLANILILTNTDVYEKEMITFLDSIDFKRPTASETLKSTTDKNTVGNNSAIVGLWGFYNSETYGNILTGGYFRKEYIFYEDGTYLYLRKDFSTTVKEILFAYETGTFAINGNQLTITPVEGKKEWWSKPANKRTNEWGKRLKMENQKLEKLSYSFEIRYLLGMEKNYLYLNYNKPTERDGKKSNNNSLQEFSYSQRKLNESLIKFPPGTKINLAK